MKIIQDTSPQVFNIVQDLSNQSFFQVNPREEALSRINPLVGLPVALQQDLVRHYINKRELVEE